MANDDNNDMDNEPGVSEDIDNNEEKSDFSSEDKSAEDEPADNKAAEDGTILQYQRHLPFLDRKFDELLSILNEKTDKTKEGWREQGRDQTHTQEDVPQPNTGPMTEHVEDAVLPVRKAVRVPAHEIVQVKKGIQKAQQKDNCKTS